MIIGNLGNRGRRGCAAFGYRAFRIENHKREVLSGFGDGDFIRLRDGAGNEWQGSAEQHGDTIRLQFRDGRGHYATGIASNMGVMLKDDQGHIWRGYLQ